MAERAKGIQIHRPIVYGSVARLLTPSERALCKDPNHTHTWTVFVRSAASPAADIKGRERERTTDDELLPGGADDMAYFLKRVSFRLHDSFPTPLRNIDRPPYQVTETGWGEFPLQIRLTFVPEAQEKPVHIVHNLKLHHYLPVAPVPAPAVPGGGAAATAAEAGSMQVDGAPAVAGAPALAEGEVAQVTTGDEAKVDPIIVDAETNTVQPPASATAAAASDPSASAPFSGTPNAVADAAAVPVDLTALADKSSLAAQTTAPAASGAPPAAVVPTGPVNAYQYDELVFTNPPAAFLALLQAHAPTPLPVQPRVKGRLEFTLGMEREEGERIDEGRREVVRETDGWRKRLIEAEREVARLRTEVGGF